ncbi:MAG: M23 family metallopeptidase [Spirochaetaceae bacterium]
MRALLRRVLPILLFLTLIPGPLPARSPYPAILRPDRSDPLFLQHQSAIEGYHRAAAQGERLPSLRIYEYRLRGERSLTAVAARFTLTAESLATLNRLPDTEIPEGRESVLIPSLPGLFLPEEPASRFERLLTHERTEELAHAEPFTVVVEEKPVRFRFLPEERLSAAEQKHFLGSFFRMPLEAAEITSPFGYRIHPVFGHRSFHRGVDLRATRGTGVYAAAAGEVVEIGRNGILGAYVVIEHAGRYTTTYAHLSEVTVTLKQEVLSGTMVGKVGNTGISTGPHLHFEIAQGEQLFDPLELLPLISE